MRTALGRATSACILGGPRCRNSYAQRAGRGSPKEETELGHMRTAASSPIDVLIVDDNASLAASAKRLLELNHARVDVAGTAELARKRFAEHAYRLALVDLML